MRPSRVVGVAIGGLALLLMAWVSTAPLPVESSDDAVIRLSIAARPERIETCRRVSNEELEKLAPQMRQQVICEGTTARYRLEVRRNDRLLHSQIVRGGGLRHDRQLYVSRDFRVPPGSASLRVDLVRIDTVRHDDERERDDEERDDEERDEGEGDDRREDDAPDDDDRRRHGDFMRSRHEREAEERRRRREEAIPTELRVEASHSLASREVLLVTYDPDQRRLVARRAPAR